MPVYREKTEHSLFTRTVFYPTMMDCLYDGSRWLIWHSFPVLVNGQRQLHDVADNTLLVDYLRETLGLTGTHIGCDTSQCGACVVHVNGVSVKACTMLAAQADGTEITTIEGISDGENLHPMQEAFHNQHGLQCGFAPWHGNERD